MPEPAPIPGQIVDARDVVPGDGIILPVLGARLVVDVDQWVEDTGLEPGPRITIVYQVVGSGNSYENRARAHGRSSFPQSECTVRPLKPDDRVAITRRAA
jgi:hypothetical protein